MLRSASCGMMRVHQRLNAGRAITLCWIANRPSRPALISSATPSDVSRAESIDFGTHEVADEADRVEEGGEEDGVARHAVQEYRPAFHVRVPRVKRKGGIGINGKPPAEPDTPTQIFYWRRAACRAAASRVRGCSAPSPFAERLDRPVDARPGRRPIALGLVKRGEDQRCLADIGALRRVPGDAFRDP